MKKHNLRAVILVAGRGERLRPLTTSTPKSLLTIGPVAILGNTLQILQSAAVGSVTLVTGFHSEKIRRFVEERFPKIRARFHRNTSYSTTNTLYSLMHAKSAVTGKPFLLLDGDLLFDASVLAPLLSSSPGSILACDSSVLLDDEAVRAIGDPDGRIRLIGKKIDKRGTGFGESIGLAKIEARASRRLFQIGPGIIRDGGRRFYYEAAFQTLIDEGYPFHTVDVRGRKWVEIDTSADLRRARALFAR